MLLCSLIIMGAEVKQYDNDTAELIAISIFKEVSIVKSFYNNLTEGLREQYDPVKDACIQVDKHSYKQRNEFS